MLPMFEAKKQIPFIPDNPLAANIVDKKPRQKELEPLSLWEPPTLFGRKSPLSLPRGFVPQWVWLGRPPKWDGWQKISWVRFWLRIIFQTFACQAWKKTCLETCTMKPQLATCLKQDKSANKSCYSSQGLALKQGHVFWILQMLVPVGFFCHCSPFLVYSLRGSL